jgi:NAD(P)-dependent dehydrogenase (short-subunit alcohol dehydrogenase family)
MNQRLNGENTTVQNLFSVDGKITLITGGSSGIGEMMATGYVMNGAKVYIASRKLDECERVAEELSAHGTCIPLQVDLSNMEGIEGLAAQIEKREGKLDVLINNSGANWAAPFEDYPEEGWDKVFDVNVKAPFFLTQKLAPALRAATSPADPSRVISTSSINGLTVPDLETYAYSASKAGLIHMTRVLARKLAPDINVNTIAPGPFQSRMMKDTLARKGDAYIEAMPAKRIGIAEDAAGTAIFLGSRASAFITGACLELDGGISTTS